MTKMFEKRKLRHFLNTIANNKLRNTIYYFSEETPGYEEVYSENKILGELYKQFDLNDIKRSTILKFIDENKNDNDFSNVLELDRNFSPAYFNFWAGILQDNGTMNISPKLLTSIAPHLFRSLVLYEVNIDECFEKHILCAGSNKVPYSAYGILQTIIKVIAKFEPEMQRDFIEQYIEVLLGILRRLINYDLLQVSDSFVSDTMKLSTALMVSLNYTFPKEFKMTLLNVAVSFYEVIGKKTELTQPLKLSMKEFLVSIIIFAKSSSESNSKTLKKFFTTTIALIKTLNRIVHNKKCTVEAWQDLIEDMANAILTLASFPTVFDEKEAACALYESAKNILEARVQTPDNSSIETFKNTKGSYDYNSFEPIDKDTYFYEPSDAAKIMDPSIEKDSKIIRENCLKLGTTMIELCKKSRTFTVELMVKFESDKQPLLPHLLLLYILNNVGINTIINLTKDNPSFINTLMSSSIFSEAAFMATDDVFTEWKKLTESFITSFLLAPQAFNLIDIIYVINISLKPDNPCMINSVCKCISKSVNVSSSGTKILKNYEELKKLIEADCIFKKHILCDDPNKEILMKARNAIFHLITVLFSKEAFNEDFFNSQEMNNYIISLALERQCTKAATRAITYSLKTAKTGYLLTRINEFINYCINSNEKEKTLIFSTTLVSCIAEAFTTSSLEQAKIFIDFDMPSTISKLCAVYSQDSNCVQNIHDYLLATLTCYYNLCRMGNEAMDRIAKSNYLDNITRAIDNISKNGRMTDDIINIILYSVGNEKVSLGRKLALRNKTAVSMLLKLSVLMKDEQYLYNLTDSVLEDLLNAYFIFNSSLLYEIINSLEDYPPYIYSLIAATGDFFFSANEITALFNKLNTLDSTHVTKILKLIESLIFSKKSFNSYCEFTVKGEPSTFISPAFSTLSMFQLSFEFSLDRLEAQPFLHILASKEKILVVIGRNISIFISDGKHKTELKNISKEALQTDKWYQFSMFFRDGKISIRLNKQQYEFDIDPKFKFTTMVTFTAVVSGIKTRSCQISHLASKSLEVNASVPFPSPFIDAFNMSAGPSVFLPLIANISKYENTFAVFEALMNVFNVMAKKDESLFSRKFFRAFAALVHREKKYVINEATTTLLSQMLLSLNKPALCGYMLQSLWLDFDFWKTFSDDENKVYNVMDIAINKTLTELYEKKRSIFYDKIDISSLINRYYMALGPKAEKSRLVTGIYSLIGKICVERFPAGTAFTTFMMMALRTEEDVLSERTNSILCRMLSANKEYMMTQLKDYEYINPFLELISSESPQLQRCGVFLTYYIYNSVQHPSQPLYNYLLSVSGSLKAKYDTDKALEAALACMYGEVEFNKGDFIITSGQGNHIIKYPDYITLIAAFSAFASQPVLENTINSIAETICGKSDSQHLMCHFFGWRFWFEYIAFSTGYPDALNKAVAVLHAQEFKANHDPKMFNELLAFLVTVSQRTNQRFQERAMTLLFYLASEVDPAEIIRIALIAACFPLGMSYIQHPEYQNTDAPLGQYFKWTYITVYKKEEMGATVTEPLFNESDEDLVYTTFKKFVCKVDSWKTLVPITETHKYSYIVLCSVIVSTLYAMFPEKMQSLVDFILTTCEKGFFFDDERENALLYLAGHPSLPEESKAPIVAFITKKCSKGTNVKSKIKEKYSTISSEILSLHDEIVNDIDKYCGKLSSGLSNNYFKVLVKFSGNVFDKIFFTNTLEQEKKRLLQSSMQNEKGWSHIQKDLQETGRLGAVTEVVKHWKLDETLDGIGRRIRLKQNRHFDDHHDASLQRDSGEPTKKESVIKPFVLAEPSNDSKKVAYFHSECQMITISRIYFGTVNIYNDSIMFESQKVTSLFSSNPVPKSKIVEIEKNSMRMALTRLYTHEDNGAEVFTRDGKSYFFVLPSGERDSFMKQLRKFDIYVQKDKPWKVINDFKIVEQWKSGAMSNYEYLYWLNIIGGRSFNDLTQYPVFPWVIKDYTSDKIDVRDPTIYRDLSKPMGQIDQNRWEQFCMLYDELDDPMMKCHYRVFYSSPGYVIGYLIRMEPFATLHIELQSGQFDHPGRLFTNMADVWRSASSMNGDLRELIPEFYTMDSFLVNHNNFDLGKLNDVPINDVVLPPWAKSPAEFVHINRLALESTTVSETLNEWVDLIFGYKQRGQNAIDAGNDFHPYSYPEIMDSPGAEDMKQVFVAHALNFGVVPSQVFKNESPKRVYMPPQLKYFSPATQVNIKDANIVLNIGQSLAVIKKNSESIDFYKLEKTEKPTRSTLLKLARNINTSKITKCIIPINSDKLCIIKSQWARRFSIYSVLEGEAKEIFMSHRHGGYISTIAYDTKRSKDEFLILTASGSKDSSLFVQLFKYASRELTELSFEIYVGMAPINCVDVSLQLDLVASVDEGANLVYSSFRSNSVICTAKLEEAANRVFVFQGGHVIVISDIENKNSEEEVSKLSHICVYNMMCQKVTEISTARIQSASKMTLGASDYIICGFEDNTIDVLDSFTLSVLCHFEVDDVATSLCYLPEESSIVFGVSNGNVYSVRL